MARTTPLNDTQIKQAKVNPNKVVKLSDGGGLQLVIKPSGAKIWHLRYMKPIINKQTTLSLGNYPAVSLAKARLERTRIKTLLANNIDPKQQRDDEMLKAEIAQSNSFSAVFTDWIRIKKESVSIKQGNLIEQSFKNHLLPYLGKYPIAELKPAQVIKAIKKVEGKGKIDLTKRLCGRINEVMNYAANIGLINSNPLSGITSAFKAPKSTPYPAIKPEQLPWLLKIINQADLKIVTRCLIEWQLHTMTRPNEACRAKWVDIDIKKQLWSIPKEIMKTDKPHLVPLTPQTLGLLEKLAPITGEQTYVFSAFSGKKGHINIETVNKAFRRIGLKGIQTAHGLRSVASTTLNEQGFDYDVIESALAHIDENQVRRAYNRTDYMERRKKLMILWSDHIEQCSTGNFSVSGSLENVKRLKMVSKVVG